MNKEELELKIGEEEGDMIDVYLCPEKMPETYRRKKYELVHRSGMTEAEADRYILTTPVQLELFYDIDRGLFSVEAEAGECTPVYNPYTGRMIPNDHFRCTPPTPRETVDRMIGDLEDMNSELKRAWEEGDFNPADSQRIEDAHDSIEEALTELHCLGEGEEGEEE
jgi:hypothetical protein